MNGPTTSQALDYLAGQAGAISQQLRTLSEQAAQETQIAFAQAMPMAAANDTFFVDALTVLVLAGFVGYYVIWNVTPALHAPLMGITNAISSVIILGALLATGAAATGLVHGLGFVAIVLASVNIFGGFLVTYRMLDMFKSKTKAKSTKA